MEAVCVLVSSSPIFAEEWKSFFHYLVKAKKMVKEKDNVLRVKKGARHFLLQTWKE